MRPLLVACAAFVAGAHFGIQLPFWAALLVVPFFTWKAARVAAQMAEESKSESVSDSESPVSV